MHFSLSCPKLIAFIDPTKRILSLRDLLCQCKVILCGIFNFMVF
jgi:hypothetical protein